MVARHIFAGLLSALAMMPPAYARDTLVIKDCYDESNPTRAKLCRTEAWAAYQAIQVVQTQYHTKQQTCQLGTNISSDQLAENLRVNALAFADLTQDMTLAAVVIGSLSPPAHCPLGIAAEIGGLRTGDLLRTCMDGIKPGNSPDACLGIAAAMRDSFAALSGYEGGEDFYCPPGGKQPDAGTVIKLLITETKLDIHKQQHRSAGEVIAEALARAYPCH